MIHGRKYEKAAIQDFTKITGNCVEPSGLFISAQYPFLAASPDGLVADSHLVEVKCPLRGFRKPVSANSAFPFLYCEQSDNSLHLKRDSKYYLQIQGQLGITGRRCCYFVVYTGVDCFFEDINFDKNYWTVCMVPRLKLFYEKHYRPYIVSTM